MKHWLELQRLAQRHFGLEYQLMEEPALEQAVLLFNDKAKGLGAEAELRELTLRGPVNATGKIVLDRVIVDLDESPYYVSIPVLLTADNPE